MRRRVLIQIWSTRIVGAATLVAAGVWALLPLGESQIAVPHLEPASTSHDLQDPERTWTESSFAASLWTLPPVPPPDQNVEPPHHRVSQLKLQLVGIANAVDGRRIAVLYDPDIDALVFAATGEAAGPFIVEEVLATGVVLADGEEMRELTLATGEEGG